MSAIEDVFALPANRSQGCHLHLPPWNLDFTKPNQTAPSPIGRSRIPDLGDTALGECVDRPLGVRAFPRSSHPRSLADFRRSPEWGVAVWEGNAGPSARGAGLDLSDPHDATLLNAARSDPVGFARGLDRAVIDEVQLAPDLLPAVKRSIDEDRRPGRFLLTGSANILTIPRVKGLLAGRMEILPLYPLSRGEVLGSNPPRFLASAFAGRAPAPAHETLVGEDLVATVLAGGYPEVLARSSERRRALVPVLR